MNLKSDIKGTFDQITVLNTGSGTIIIIIPLYKDCFNRIPNPDGIRYWIVNFYSGKDEERAGIIIFSLRIIKIAL